jgi:hypothetical protein
MFGSLSARTKPAGEFQSINIAKTVLIYLSCSLLLSISIIFRLFFGVGGWLDVINSVLYFGVFLVVPMSAAAWLLFDSAQRKLRAKWFFFAIFVVYGFLLIEMSAFPFIPEYLFSWFAIPLMVGFYTKRHEITNNVFKKRTIAFVIAGLIIAILLPNVVTFFSVNGLINKSVSFGSESMKASFISERVYDMTAFGWPPRAETDYWKFLLAGAGQCGEMAVTGTVLMNEAGLSARTVVLSGEDHEVIEVKVDGQWLVAAPGDTGGQLRTRAEFAAARIAEVGCLSYVVATTQNGFIELTQEYVNTDTIIIKIMRNGEPLADAQVVLKHRFENLMMQLPCNDYTFHTNFNGTVTLHLGNLHYINEFKGSEEYYWIYVNGQNTGFNVTSTGTGQIYSVQVDLSR